MANGDLAGAYKATSDLAKEVKLDFEKSRIKQSSDISKVHSRFDEVVKTQTIQGVIVEHMQKSFDGFETKLDTIIDTQGTMQEDAVLQRSTTAGHSGIIKWVVGLVSVIATAAITHYITTH